MGLTLLAPPTSEAVSLDEAKAQLRVSATSEDAYIGTLISAASRWVERYTSRSLSERQWLLTLDAFADAIELPMGPVISIDAVEYANTSGSTVTLDAENYTLDSASEPQWLVRNTGFAWPALLDAVNTVSITYTAGPEELPAQYADLKMAILLLVGHFYQHRDESAPIPEAVEYLCGPFRLPTLR